ncbi:MAG: hypothetical protein IJC46_04275 [Clostridia bacterium]|nr:hypothetical protein [Clostridia bacterium]
MKKVISLVTVVVMLLAMVPAVFAAAVPVGYTAITSQAELAAIANNLSGKYILTKNITLTEDFAPIATDPDAPFEGILDGAGYTIYNLSVSVETVNTTVGGLFGYNAGTVCNLNLADATVTVDGMDPYANTYTYAGGIAAVNSGTIEGCSISGSVCGSSTTLTAYVGGIVGENKGTVSKCAAYATVESVGISEAVAGGIAGWNKGTVANCFNARAVAGTAAAEDTVVRAGGIAGKNGFAGNGTISCCHNVGAVSAADGEAYVGGISGNNLKTVENSYYLSTTAASQVGTSAEAVGAISEADYKNQAKFAGFDFDTVWTIAQYPVLQGVVVLDAAGDANGDGTVNTADVLYMMRYCNLHAGVSVSLAAGDLNGDGSVDIADVVRLMKQITV